MRPIQRSLARGQTPYETRGGRVRRVRDRAPTLNTMCSPLVMPPCTPPLWLVDVPSLFLPSGAVFTTKGSLCRLPLIVVPLVERDSGGGGAHGFRNLAQVRVSFKGGAKKRCTGKAASNLKTLGGRNGQHGVGQHGLDLVETRFAQAHGHVAAHTGHNASDAVVGVFRCLDGLAVGEGVNAKKGDICRLGVHHTWTILAVAVGSGQRTCDPSTTSLDTTSMSGSLPIA